LYRFNEDEAAGEDAVRSEDNQINESIIRRREEKERDQTTSTQSY
jgi:hypothetical protein